MYRMFVWAITALVAALFLGGCSRATAEPTPPPPSVTAKTAPTATAKINETPSPTLSPTETPAPIPSPQTITVTVPIDPTSQGCDEPQETVVVGALLPLSSPGAMRSGFAMQAALNQALNDVNALGGIHNRPVQLITYDTAGIPSRGARFAERLILHDCARSIVGLYHSNVASAVRDVAAQYGVPLIIAEAAADGLISPDAPEVFRIAPNNSMINSMDARWLSAMGDYNGDEELTAVLVVEDTNYGRFHAEQAERWMPDFGIKPKTLVADLPTDDFSPVIARIVDMEMAPDAVFIKVRDDSSMNIQRQLLDAGIGPETGTLIVRNGAALDDERFWPVMPDGEGTVARHIGPWPSTATAIGHLFAVNYMAAFDRWPERYAFSAYDAFMLAADAMKRAPSLAPADVVESLAQSDIELASGHYYFPPADESLQAAGLPELYGRQWPDVHTLFLQYSEPFQQSEQMIVLWPETYQRAD